ncbi:hypothetical protein EW145_g3163 [Phellinidium pouzarii]|uniref:Holliday junction resolvase Gen1 C-terminal domain-containing protein n=1 Tax=Phellinidium pouzarii TaxID=167371 RepID=A0A4S4L829_9AGAM|nr:hypothetical protein EW145_g3163 [Phellinidium pouzarii]
MGKKASIILWNVALEICVRARDPCTNPQIGMTQGGMIFFALLKGEDYDGGLTGFGKAIAHALARCGFGDELFEAFKNSQSRDFQGFLLGWRRKVNEELQENKRGFLLRTPQASLFQTVSKTSIFFEYAEPAIRTGGSYMRSNSELCFPQVAGFCEKFFEWGTRDNIIKRFLNLLWESGVLRILRRASGPPPYEAVGMPLSLISKYLNSSAVERRSEAFIHSSRQHVSTDKSFEYHLEVDPSKFVELAHTGIKGTRKYAERGGANKDAEEETIEDGDPIDDKTKTKTVTVPAEPFNTFRMWCPASMLWRVNPKLVEEHELTQEKKKKKKRSEITRKAYANARANPISQLPQIIYKKPASSSSLAASRTLLAPLHTRLDRTSSAFRSSDDGWGVDNTSSLYLYQIADPCDPDLVDRDDLRINTDLEHKQGPVWRWSNLSLDDEQDKNAYEDEDDFEFHDDRMDRVFQGNFMRKSPGSKFWIWKTGF